MAECRLMFIEAIEMMKLTCAQYFFHQLEDGWVSKKKISTLMLFSYLKKGGWGHKFNIFI